MSPKMNGKLGLAAKLRLFSIAALAVLLYLVATPLHKSMAQNAPSNLVIMNFENCPLKIESATVTNLSARRN